MSKISEQIRAAALGPSPAKPANTHVWFDQPHGTGPHPLGKHCDAFLSNDEHLSDMRNKSAQRTFLLLVAEALK
jgi:hypothetical protein